MAKYQGYGNPLDLQGKLAADRATAVPLTVLNTQRQYPIPATIGGSSNVTFTLKGSTRPIAIYAENDLIFLDEDLAYTWNNTSNNILASTGAASTDVDSVLGVWYMYVAITLDSGSAWQYELRPSQTAPEATAGPNGMLYLGHPGTSKVYPWRYVGFMVCTTAATPAFLTMVKIGYYWHWADLSNPTTSAWVVTSLYTVRLPKLAKLGGMVVGFMETGKAGSVAVSASSVAAQGVVKTNAQLASSIVFAPFEIPGPNDTNGELYAIDTTARGDIHVTQYKDVV